MSINYHYLLLDTAYLIQLYETRSNPHEIFESIINKYQKIYSINDNSILKILLFVDLNNNIRILDYKTQLNVEKIKLLNNDFLQKHMNTFEFNEMSFSKIKGVYQIDDLTKKHFEMCCLLNSIDDKVRYSNTLLTSEQQCYLDELKKMLKLIFPKSTITQVMYEKNESKKYIDLGIEDAICSCINHLRQKHINNESVSFVVISNKRSLITSNIYFLPTENFNFEYKRVIQLNGEYCFESYPINSILTSLANVYNFPAFKSGALHDFLINLPIEKRYAMLEQIIKSIEIVDLGFFINKDGKKSKLLPRFGLKKFNELCGQYISFQHFYEMYDELPNKNKFKKQFSKPILEMIFSIIDINRLRIIV